MTRKSIWLESHGRRFAQQGWRKAAESVSGYERGLGCTAVVSFRWAAQKPGFGPRCNALALPRQLGLAGYVVKCDSVSKKKVNREKEGGRVVGMMALCGGVQTILGQSSRSGLRGRRNWTAGAVSAG